MQPAAALILTDLICWLAKTAFDREPRGTGKHLSHPLGAAHLLGLIQLSRRGCSLLGALLAALLGCCQLLLQGSHLCRVLSPRGQQQLLGGSQPLLHLLLGHLQSKALSTFTATILALDFASSLCLIRSRRGTWHSFHTEPQWLLQLLSLFVASYLLAQPTQRNASAPDIDKKHALTAACSK